MAVNSQHHLTNCIEKYMDSRKIKKYMEKLDICLKDNQPSQPVL